METALASLRPYHVILVTGPQRSGTTFAANVLAAELARRYVDEQDVRGDPHQCLAHLLQAEQATVVQCPGWSRFCHRMGSGRTAVVWMRRPLEEIIASQERIGWTERCEAAELARYGVTRGPIAQVKFDYWRRRQKAVLGPHAFEIEYGALRGHPMWVRRSGRRGFEAKQIAPGEGNLQPRGLPAISSAGSRSGDPGGES
ncbi:MAG TPA: hypothetical protein VLU25_05945 [Acidobacteriota bacterium]|nr:hypothetical protein [Acidobacteriota bacterium]